MALMGLVSIIIWLWQIKVLQGKAMKNPDGSVDDWHEQKILYGIALADIFLACPATIASIVLIFVYPRRGYYILALVSFFFFGRISWLQRPACVLKTRKSPSVGLSHSPLGLYSALPISYGQSFTLT